MLKQAKVYIKGDVVAVGFRAWAKIQAKLIGVTGWVRNVYDQPDVFGLSGGVAALIQGEEDKVEKMLTKLKEGPPVCLVDEVEVFWQEPKEIFDQFEIRR